MRKLRRNVVNKRYITYYNGDEVVATLCCKINYDVDYTLRWRGKDGNIHGETKTDYHRRGIQHFIGILEGHLIQNFGDFEVVDDEQFLPLKKLLKIA